MKIYLPAILAGIVIASAFPALAIGQTYEFTTCGATGYEGPVQGDCDTAYTASTLDGDVTVAGGIQSWTVPTTGSYRITAIGAAGYSATDGAYNGGRGAQVSGNFNLTAGDVLQIAVGQVGLASEGGELDVVAGNGQADGPAGRGGIELDGGGGGGSFVVSNSNNPMLIAGGGGGTRYDAMQSGCDANVGQYGTTSSGGEDNGGCIVKVNGLGLGGIAMEYFDYGSAGAGFNGDGESDFFGQGGRSWANGILGGHVDSWLIPADGGFGGGGSGEGSNGGGGGGGYSGGDGGWIAGGGGSFNNGTNQAASAGIGTGDGSVTIRLRTEGEGEGGRTRATFEVTKEFTDGDNPTDVQVSISCNTGLMLDQTKIIDESEGVIFVVTDFDEGELFCEITEEALGGYIPTYLADGPGIFFNSDGGCNFEEIQSGDVNTCHIINDAAYVEIDIEKVWVIDGSGGDSVDTRYQLTLYCNAPIEDDDYCYGYGDSPVGDNGYSCKNFYGDDSDVFTAYVQPEYPSSSCWVEEYVYDSAVEIDNGCGNLVISAGVGDSCVITNSVFFEGIPTLNQYGMAVLALLMLGLGLVGFRRFA